MTMLEKDFFLQGLQKAVDSLTSITSELKTALNESEKDWIERISTLELRLQKAINVSVTTSYDYTRLKVKELFELIEKKEKEHNLFNERFDKKLESLNERIEAVTLKIAYISGGVAVAVIVVRELVKLLM